MTPRGIRLLWLLIGVGTLGRVILAFATVGLEFDIENYRAVGMALDQPFDLYTTVNSGFGELGGFEVRRWPYPSGAFPWIGAALGASNLTGLPFHGVIQLGPIAADAGIAWLVQEFLGRRGASERTRLAAAALVALGPSFWLISGYHGQMDSMAILPAVAALLVWERSPLARRALYAGLLIGLAGSVKTVPLFMVLALLPSVRSLREGAELLGAAAAVPLLAMLPFVIGDFDAVKQALTYTGAPGLGGATLVMQPELARANLTGQFAGVRVSDAVLTIHDLASVLVVLTLAAVGAFLLRFRHTPVQAAVLLWVAFFVVAPAYFLHYVVWGLPFFIMAGYLRGAALLQLLLLPAGLVFYLRPWESDVPVALYVGCMSLVFAGWVVATVLQARRIARGGLGAA